MLVLALPLLLLVVSPAIAATVINRHGTEAQRKRFVEPVGQSSDVLYDQLARGDNLLYTALFAECDWPSCPGWPSRSRPRWSPRAMYWKERWYLLQTIARHKSCCRRRPAALSRSCRPMSAQLQLVQSRESSERWTVRVSRRARRMSVRVYPGGRVEVVVPPGVPQTGTWMR